MKKIALIAAMVAFGTVAMADQSNAVPGFPGFEYTWGSNYTPPGSNKQSYITEVRNNRRHQQENHGLARDENRWLAPALIGGLITYAIINGQRVPVEQPPAVIYAPPPPPPPVYYIDKQMWDDSCYCWRWVRILVE
jgi:hypothetical protein